MISICVFRYTMFWIALLLIKFAFSYYVEVLLYTILFCHGLFEQSSIQRSQYHVFGSQTYDYRCAFKLKPSVVISHIHATVSYYLLFF
jgi:hypothetical protein